MATVRHSQQSFAERDPTVASTSSHARSDAAESRRVPAHALRGNSPKTVHSSTAEQTFPVLFRLADVSGISPAEELVHITPLMVDSALESIGSGKASPSAEAADNAAAANSFAALLAASPSLQQTRTGETAAAPSPAPARPIVPQATTPAKTKVAPVETEPVESNPVEPKADVSTTRQRIDRPAIKPFRRPFKITRPAWMPEIPPTLVLGMLICFSALLIGMLWRGNHADAPPNMAPAAHDDRPANDPAAMIVAVPEVPKANNVESPKANVKKTAGKPSSKKVSDAKPKASNADPDEVASNQQARTQAQPVGIPQPSITGIRALPPVETYTQENFYGQPIGGPTPQIVENPHVARQSPVHEARRPTAQFQGTITPPDAAAPHERF